MQISRRALLGGAIGMGALSALPRLSFATTTMSLGSARIDTLSDGNLVLPMEFVSDNPRAMEALKRHGYTGPQIESPCNVTLYRDGTNTVLFDVGAGPDFMPTAGKIAAAFEALGLTHDEVTHVVFTHAHPDHLWGVLDEFDEPIFANAQHMMGRVEHEFWASEAAVSQMPAGREVFAAGALRRLQALDDRVQTFEADTEILPGILAVATHGHTPGHMSFEVAQGSSSVMVVGDAIGNGHLAFDAPSWNSGSDQDAEMGIKTRVALLGHLAARQMPLVGYHLPEGGVGRVEAAGDAFRFLTDV